jgi:hypothetical protein
MSKPKQKKLTTIAKETWTLMSKYVRQRDGNRCFTCGRVTANPQAGHFKHAPRTNPVSFDERNINCQCVSCNSFGNGKLDIYAEKLVDLYGSEVLSELTFIKNTGFKGMGVSDKRAWFADKQAELKQKLDKNGGE